MNHHSPERGFTLAELAVVLVIVGLLLGGLMVPLAAQNDLRYVNETRKTLNDIRDALIGYAAANGRLPCPASSTSSGVESPVGGGNCNSVTANNAYTGFVPAVTLGIGPTDSSGFAIDAWGNRIHYAVTTANTNAFTSPYVASPAAGMKGIGMGSLSPNLNVCTESTCATPLTSNAVAVIFSTAVPWTNEADGVDEAENTDGDTRFVSHDPTPIGSASGKFDDIVIWISPNTLYNKMITANQLP